MLTTLVVLTLLDALSLSLFIGASLVGLLTAATLVAVGCSPSPGPDATDSTTDTVEETDSAAPDTTADTAPRDTFDTAEDTSPAPDTDADGPAIGKFSYVRETSDCTRNCKRGVKVNLVSYRIEDIGDRNRRQTLTSDDVQTLQNQYLTETVLDKMKNGWDCGGRTKINEVFHKFNAVPNNDEVAPDEYTKTVAGCIPDDSTQPDAPRVQNIVDKLQSLNNKYFGS